MRILYFTTSYPPYISGVSIFAARRVAAMRQSGHQVGVVMPSLDEKNQVRQENGVTEYHLRSLRNPFRVHHRFFFVTPGEVKAIITDFKPDIIHYNDPSLWPWQIAPWARQRGIKLVFSLHALTNYAALYFPVLNLFWFGLVGYWRSVLQQFDAISAPSALMMRDVTETLRLPKAPLVQISNGVDQDLFQPKPHQITAKKPLQFLYVGRLDFEKGIMILVEALSKLEGNWHLTLVGSGKCEAELRAQATTAHLTGKITFAGQQPEKKLPAFYHTADVFVIPSLNESQSIVTLQALACGLPVVASDCTAFPEIVYPGKNGWLFEVGNATALRACLAECLANPAQLQAFGQASLKIAAYHGLKHVNEIWLQTYRKLLEPTS